MSTTGRGENAEDAGGGESRWRKIYASVIVFTVFVIAALWWFSRAFSS